MIFDRLSALCRFRRDRRGNAAVIFGVSVFGLVGVAGIGIDYYTALSSKAKLDLAADAAVLAAITTAQDYVNSNSGTIVNPTSQAIAAGQAQALKVFQANAGKAMPLVTTTPTVTMTRSGQTFSATVFYSANSPASSVRSLASTTSRSATAIAATAPAPA